MAWTYTGNPFLVPANAQSYVDTVRFLVQDTDERDQLLSDGEVNGLLTNNGNAVYQAAIEACTVLQAKYARRASKNVDGLSIQWGTVAKNFEDLRKVLKAQSARHDVPTPYLGGMSQSDKETDQTDDDLVQPNFSVGMQDDTGTGIGFNDGTGFTQVVPG